MASFRIPDDLVTMLGQRRVIPFVGAGFSGVHDVPNWEKLLSSLVDEIQAGSEVDPVLSYRDISKACNGDNLQIAEYLYLVAGETIGPIRHGMSMSLQSEKPLLESTPHVELANLGAPYVYTTNFDDLIEKTYRELGLKVDVVALPRDMALGHADRTEIVKYHGDLRYEQTLVLTESQYYTRLEFESPMDLKFRSDLLGRSVLFMGYSFRDINIRVIWFRLMKMMQDVPVKDRPPSYIVRLRPNAVLDTLYEAVGLKTLVIDPDGAAASPEAQNQLLSEFLMELAFRASPNGEIPGAKQAGFISSGLIEEIENQLAAAVEQAESPRFVVRSQGRRILQRPSSPGYVVAPTPLLASIDKLLARRMTPALTERGAQIIHSLAKSVNTIASRPALGSQIVGWYLSQEAPTPGVVLLIARSLLNSASRLSLLPVILEPVWSQIWSTDLEGSDLRAVLANVQSEIEGHEDGRYIGDEDFAFAVDIAKRIASGQMLASDDPDGETLKAEADGLVGRAAEIYDSVAVYEPDPDGPPTPSPITSQIEEVARVKEEEEAAEEPTEEPPF
jgi:hypothetical protein